MFPTGVGMNRAGMAPPWISSGVPHRRGDEPNGGRNKKPVIWVFPTGVGMNRISPISAEKD